MAYSKYGNKKVKADGYTFDSLIEYRRYQQLRLLEAAGEISDLQVHVPIVLAGADKDGDGHIRAIIYEADFCYRDGDITVYEDTKGVRTDVFRLKHGLLRRLLKDRPDIQFRILGKDDV